MAKVTVKLDGVCKSGKDKHQTAVICHIVVHRTDKHCQHVGNGNLFEETDCHKLQAAADIFIVKAVFL